MPDPGAIPPVSRLPPALGDTAVSAASAARRVTSLVTVIADWADASGG